MELTAAPLTINVAELAERIYRGKPTTILAAYWAPGEGASLQYYHSEHIPTSLFCDPAMQLAGTPSSSVGRNPLPDLAQLQRAFQQWGLNAEHEVVVYDRSKGRYAARAWWVLTWAGIRNVRILDGGLAAWEAAGHQVVGGPGNRHGLCTLRPELGHLPVAEYADVQAVVDGAPGLLIDVREANRYYGRKEHLDLMAGHIPGAINVPTRDLMNPDSSFKEPAVVREAFLRAGVPESALADAPLNADGFPTASTENLIMYSGSGVHGAQGVALMAHAGFAVPALYSGGWSQWSANPANPVERT